MADFRFYLVILKFTACDFSAVSNIRW